MPRRNGKPTEADFEEAKRLGEALKNSLPNEFTLAARMTRDGHKVYPELHFKADPEIPGLFRAEVDPDFIMARKKDPMSFTIKRTPAE